jgi:hypothetical protein
VRNCPEVDMVGLTGSVVFTAWCNVETLYVETHGGEVRRKHVEFVVLLSQKSMHHPILRFVGALPPPTAQHLVTLGVPQPQIINHHRLNEYRF